MSKPRRPRPGQKKSSWPGRAPVWARKLCRDCGRPCVIAEEDTGGGRLKGALLEAEPIPQGRLVRREDGIVMRDAEHIMPGDRYTWHRCPVRSS